MRIAPALNSRMLFQAIPLILAKYNSHCPYRSGQTAEKKGAEIPEPGFNPLTRLRVALIWFHTVRKAPPVLKFGSRPVQRALYDHTGLVI
jgi:hypothetical protein